MRHDAYVFTIAVHNITTEVLDQLREDLYEVLDMYALYSPATDGKTRKDENVRER
jgi:hypothetical protein